MIPVSAIMHFGKTMGRVRIRGRAPFFLSRLLAAAAGRLPGWRALGAALLLLGLATSCGRREEPPLPDWAASITRVPGRPAREELTAAAYPNLSAESGRLPVLDAYLAAWNQRQRAPDALAPERERVLALYATAYHAQVAATDPAGFDAWLRTLWDLSGLAHTTLLVPDEVKRACAWTEPAPLPASTAGPVVLTDLRSATLLVPIDRLPTATLQMLNAVHLEACGGASGADLLRRVARGVYFSFQLSTWSPSCPLDVCGSSEPLTRTLILTPVSKIDQSPKPEWSLAAVAVHEAAHIAWFHLPDVSRDVRLLLLVPNEREAWRHTVQFLRGLLQSTSPEVQQQVGANGAGIREMLQRSRDQMRRANQVLGLPEDDETQHLALPAGMAEDSLRSLPR